LFLYDAHFDNVDNVKENRAHKEQTMLAFHRSSRLLKGRKPLLHPEIPLTLHQTWQLKSSPFTHWFDHKKASNVPSPLKHSHLFTGATGGVGVGGLCQA